MRCMVGGLLGISDLFVLCLLHGISARSEVNGKGQKLYLD